MGENLVWIIGGIAIGALAVLLGRSFWEGVAGGRRAPTTIDAEVLLERIEKVVKVVLAQGYFTEIYSHDTHRSVWGMFRSNKKALIIAKAKVVMGYDFAKLRVSRDPVNQRLSIESLPEVEIIAMDTDYEFYDINQGLMNRFEHQEYTQLLAEAKRIMQEKALGSELPQIAEQQLRVMLTQLVAGSGWEIRLPTSSASAIAAPVASLSALTAGVPHPTDIPVAVPHVGAGYGANVRDSSRDSNWDDPSIDAHRQ